MSILNIGKDAELTSRQTIIKVRWKNILATVVAACWVILCLSLLSVSNLGIIQYLGLGFAMLVAILFGIRGFRSSIVLQSNEVILRRIAPSIRLSRSQIENAYLGEESSPLKRYYVVFVLKSGRIIRMKNVFLWGVSRRSRTLAEEWVETVNLFLA
jgi:hypothetical protein